MSKAIDPKALADFILKIIGISPGQAPALQPASFSITPKVKPPKPSALPITSTGIQGYSERGMPEDWDTAMGEVLGYRWWYLVLPPELTGYIGCTPRLVTPDKFPGTLYGANNQAWSDGRLEAVCTYTRYPAMGRMHVIHQPPETREACGCGYWAAAPGPAYWAVCDWAAGA